MANTDNECKDLVVKDFYSNSTTHLADILNNQKEMQEKTYGYKYADMTLSEIKDFWHMNNHAMIDEMHEAMDALGGIKDGNGPAVWKKWKKAHDSYKDLKITDLSPGDLKELHMELIDMLHFFMNYAASVGLNAEMMYNYYFAKAEENKNRQKNNY